MCLLLIVFFGWLDGFVILQATATQKVQSDLMEMLHIPRCVKFVSTVNRPNLFYMVCLFFHCFWLWIWRGVAIILYTLGTREVFSWQGGGWWNCRIYSSLLFRSWIWHSVLLFSKGMWTGLCCLFIFIVGCFRLTVT